MADAKRRIASAFARAPGTTGLIPYLTAGFPSAAVTLELMESLGRSGVRAIELGIPFSDPIADGPEIQRASEWAVRDGVGAREALELVRKFRAHHDTPVVIMTYANPVLRMGVAEFARVAAGAGVDGILISDLPHDESPEVWRAMDDSGLDTILLVAPTTTEARLGEILERCRGFVYCLARTGVTGRASGGETGDLARRLATVRALTKLPIAVGFGISGPDGARALRGAADAVVVGAAFMRAVAQDPERGVVARVETLAQALQGALA